MPIIPWKPFWDIFEDEEDWFGRPRWGLRKFSEEMPLVRTPKMDIYENNGNVVVEAELPRIDPKNIDIEVKDNVLKVEAKTEEKKEEKGKGYYRKEISSGYFRRALPLPVEVIGEKAEASYREGILKITIPKVQAKKEEKEGIKIKVKGR
jgi:HSP20 family protein